MRFLSLLLCLLCGGCSTYEIPVVRPSTWEVDKLRAAANELLTKYNTNNVMGMQIKGKPLRIFTTHLTDEKWRERILFTPKKGSEDWNWDPGTTARIRIRYANYVGVFLQADIEFVKDRKVVTTWRKGGGFELFGYYRDMEKLGIYIPD